MKHIFGNDIKNIKIEEPTALVAGNFDGLHTGHMSLINAIKRTAFENGLKTAVVSFTPHPAVYLGKTPKFKRILTPEQKKAQLEKHGIDYYAELSFNKQLSELSPERFFDDILIGRLNCAAFAMGEDYRFGKDRTGDAETVKKICEQRNIQLTIVKTVLCTRAGEKISSSLIRKLIAEEKYNEANGLLGYELFDN